MPKYYSEKQRQSQLWFGSMSRVMQRLSVMVTTPKHREARRRTALARIAAGDQTFGRPRKWHKPPADGSPHQKAALFRYTLIRVGDGMLAFGNHPLCLSIRRKGGFSMIDNKTGHFYPHDRPSIPQPRPQAPLRPHVIAWQQHKQECATATANGFDGDFTEKDFTSAAAEKFSVPFGTSRRWLRWLVAEDIVEKVRDGRVGRGCAAIYRRAAP